MERRRKNAQAAEALRLTAQNLKELGVCDEVVKEPTGGAHRNPKDAITAVGKSIEKLIAKYDGKSADEIRKDRRTKYLKLGSKGLAA